MFGCTGCISIRVARASGLVTRVARVSSHIFIRRRSRIVSRCIASSAYPNLSGKGNEILLLQYYIE